ncbi:DEAD/DEAH box helicase family protein [Streptomyces sp. NPDC052023]|uniref:DEAD/DEAH box helicase family protein n=1 Tax=Streptomyces sp. NPDC052023 TaxID=3365681 RepID=UPI0037D6E322
MRSVMVTPVESAVPRSAGRPVLFPDQAEAVDRLVRHLHRPGSRGLFVSATGTGKTLVSVRVRTGSVRGWCCSWCPLGSGGADGAGLAPGRPQ